MNYFERPELLYTIPFVLIYSFFFYKFRFHENKMTLNIGLQLDKSETSVIESINKYFPFLRFISIILLILSLAGPGSRSSLLPDEKNGIDIMIAIDVSGSMVRSNDFLPKNRLEVSKDLIKNFVKKRVNDRMGLVIFGGAAYLQSPLTNDIESLVEVITEINQGSVDEQGTAIGDSIILSTYRLKNSKAKSKVMIVITDGVSNTGKIDPITAAETASKFGIKIYSIGIGKELQGEFETDFDSLQQIAEKTDGLFYRATDSNEFAEVLNSIDTLEKENLNVKPRLFVEPYYMHFLLPAVLLLVFDFLIRSFYLRYYI
jgi:Ca-activated chloride channel homolog